MTTLLHTTRKTPPGGRFRLDMPVVARAANLAEVSLKVLLLNPELDFVALQVLVLVHGATAAAVVTSWAPWKSVILWVLLRSRRSAFFGREGLPR